MKKNETILVTGARGMIGSALVRLLKESGFSALLAPTHTELELRDQSQVDAFFNKHRPAYVFHLAARVGGIHANATYPGQFIADNTLMQTLIFEAAHKFGIKKILFPGSACTYPKMAPQPVKEDSLGTGPIEPTNLAYGTAKLNGIVMAQSFAREYGMNIIVPMPTNAYGPGDNFNPKASHVIPALMSRMHEAKAAQTEEISIWGSGAPLREFIYADDVADAFLFLMERYDNAAPINVGTGQEISIKSLSEKIKEVVGYKGRLVFDTSKPDGAPRKTLDSSQLFALGWKPNVALEEGLRRMYEKNFC